MTNSKLDYCSLSNSLNLFSTEMSGPQFIKEMLETSRLENLYVGVGAQRAGGENEKRQDSVILVLKKLFT